MSISPSSSCVTGVRGCRDDTTVGSPCAGSDAKKSGAGRAEGLVLRLAALGGDRARTAALDRVFDVERWMDRIGRLDRLGLLAVGRWWQPRSEERGGGTR